MNHTRFAEVSDGFQSFAPRAVCRRHRHDVAYAAIVLAGGYVEAGEGGRHRVASGDVLVHHAFDAHCDRFDAHQSLVLNLRLPQTVQLTYERGRLRDPDRLARLAERSCEKALLTLLEEMEPSSDQAPGDWTDVLARELAARKNIQIATWANAHGLTREAVCRGFGKAFGVPPARFRLEARARKAWRLLTTSSLTLSSVADQCGFSDQAHMTRAVHSLTGRPPGAWRRSHTFKTTTAA